jgi:hypothetical protein
MTLLPVRPESRQHDIPLASSRCPIKEACAIVLPRREKFALQQIFVRVEQINFEV